MSNVLLKIYVFFHIIGDILVIFKDSLTLLDPYIGKCCSIM